MNLSALIVGILSLGCGCYLIGNIVVSATRPVWGKYYQQTRTIPKKRKSTLTRLGRVLGVVMLLSLAAFLLTFGGLLITATFSATSMTGWLGMVALLSFGVTVAASIVFGLFDSAMSTPIEATATPPHALDDESAEAFDEPAKRRE